jgi:hypothetical protein
MRHDTMTCIVSGAVVHYVNLDAYNRPQACDICYCQTDIHATNSPANKHVVNCLWCIAGRLARMCVSREKP